MVWVVQDVPYWRRSLAPLTYVILSGADHDWRIDALRCCRWDQTERTAADLDLPQAAYDEQS